MKYGVNREAFAEPIVKIVESFNDVTVSRQDKFDAIFVGEKLVAYKNDRFWYFRLPREDQEMNGYVQFVICKNNEAEMLSTFFEAMH